MSESKDPRSKPGSAEAIFAAWATEYEANGAVHFEDLLYEHPDLVGELRELHHDWILFAPLLGRVVPGLVSGNSTHELNALSSQGPPASQTPPEDPSKELLDRLQIEVPNSGRYKFRAVVGRGGGGVVLKVWDTKLHRSLAMKVVLGRTENQAIGDTPNVDARTLTRFVDEARIASQLNHPGIVPVHELGTDETGRAFFTMKLVHGEDLSRVFHHVRTGEDGWNETRALGVLLRACEAMSFAHEKDVVHRDLKPANIMVGRHGEVYVMDWGLARVLGEEDHRDLRLKQPPSASSSLVDSLRRGEREEAPDSPLVTMDGTVIGTPAYMSPEQARGEQGNVGTQSDVYAFGAMLYELLAGQPPFIPSGERVSPQMIVMRALEGPPKPLSELAPDASQVLVAICERAMQREPIKRYADVSALATDLRAYLERRVVGAYESGKWAETRMWMRRNRALTTSIAAGILILIAGLVFSLSEKARADRFANEKAEQARAAEKARDMAQASERRATKATEAAVLSADRARSAKEETDLRSLELGRQLYVTSVLAAQSALANHEHENASRYLDSAPERLRGWEWKFLSASTDNSILRIGDPPPPDEDLSPFGKALSVSALESSEFSPDGQQILTTHKRGRISLWSATSGQSQFTLIDDYRGRMCNSPPIAAFSPDSAHNPGGPSVRYVPAGLVRRIGSADLPN